MNMRLIIMLAFLFILLGTIGAYTAGLGEPAVPAQFGEIDEIDSQSWAGISSFWALFTFSLDIPVVLNMLIISPFIIGLAYLAIVIFRGGAN